MNKILILLMLIAPGAFACKKDQICVEFIGGYTVVRDSSGKETYHKYDAEDLPNEDELVDKLYKERYGNDDSVADVPTSDRRLLPTVERDGEKEEQ